MLPNRDLKLDLLALALAALTVFLALSLTTFDPADPPAPLPAPFGRLTPHDQLAYPANEAYGNLCGCWGALAASTLLHAAGLASYYVVLSLGVVAVLLLMRRAIDLPVLRFVGWLISLVGVAALASLTLSSVAPGPVIGAGGYLGALGSGLLREHFAAVGAAILAASTVMVGLLISTDYALLQVAGQLLSGSVRIVEATTSLRLPRWFSEDELQLAEEEERPRTAVDLLAGLAEEEVDEQDEEPLDASAAATESEFQLQDEQPEPELPGELSIKHPDARRADKPQREPTLERIRETPGGDEAAEYELPPLELLLPGEEVNYDSQEEAIRRNARVLEKTFADFGFNVKVVEIETGPVIAQYELQLEAGLRLAKITSLAEDLAIALRVPSVRIVAPIPGKNTVGVEVPNDERQMVRLREVIEEADARVAKMDIPLFMGQDVAGRPLVIDLAKMPHLLIAGRTGTGKSVCLNAIISSMLMTRRPDEVRMLMIDPKMVELSGYGTLPHLMHPVVTDMKRAEAILAWAVEKMEERYSLLAQARVRHLRSYNQLSEEQLRERLQPETEEDWAAMPKKLPYIVIVADEMADLMMTAGKEVEQHIIRLAQKSRAVGIHLILATQKPTVDVVTGLIKSNLPARISFQVASRTDSRVVLDENGADKLLGNGDMLFLVPGTSQLLRGQGTYLSDEEITEVVDFVSTGEQDFVEELVRMKVESGDGVAAGGPLKKRDELYEGAVDVVVREGRGSVSLLQRTLGIGYGRAARLIDYMAEDGIVGQYNGSQAREILVTLEEWERMQGAEGDEEPFGSDDEPDHSDLPWEEAEELEGELASS